ncbi:MAG: hypothetical protein RI897_3113 [Verrucomicrobiota bacterium]
MGFRDIALAIRQDSDEESFAGTHAHVTGELVVGPGAVVVFVAPLEELGLAFASFFRVIWEWKAEAGVAGGKFGPDRYGEVGIDFVGGDLSVVVGVEV